MPIHAVKLPDGATGYQWGEHGGKYRDRSSAARQERAARANADALATSPNGGVLMGRRANDSNVRALVKNLLAFFAEEADEPQHADDDGSVRAAGVAVRAPDGSLLFVRRKGADHEGEWAFPGGVAEGGEAPDETARRELEEETGHRAEGLEPAYATRVGDVDFATFLHQAPDRFEPKLNDEAGEHRWATPDEAPEPLHPAVALALGRDMATDPPVSEAQRRAMFAAASGHSKLGISKKVGEEFVGKDGTFKLPPMKMPKVVDDETGLIALRAHDSLAYDNGSVRSYDRDGRLHVALTNISKAAINPYRGGEIPACKLDHEHDESCVVPGKLDPAKTYNLLRDPDELAKSVATWNGLPLLGVHKSTSAVDHPKEIVVGATGTDARFDAPYLRNSLVVWPKDAIDGVEDDRQGEISCGYRYRADMRPGTWGGQPYDGVMRDIVGNHVALVKEGRAGADVVVGDAALAKSTTEPWKEFDMPQPKTRLGIYLHGVLSTMVKKPWDKGGKEVALALDSAFAGVTAVALGDKAKRDALKASVSAIPQIAQDADLEGMHKFIDRLDPEMMPEKADELLEDPNKKASDAETDEEKEKREKDASDKKARDDWEKSPEFKSAKDSYDARRAKDAAPEMKPEGIDKKAMDEAITSAVDRVRAEERAIREAERFVQPWVGALAMAFDSAEQVHRKALDLLNVEHKGVHASALPAIIKMVAKPGDKPRRREGGDKLAQDQAGVKPFAERYPGAGSITVLQ